MPSQRYTIQQLAELSGLSRRTIRYYIQEGLLDPPAGRGRGGFYYDSHLKRLSKIKRLRARGLKLAAVAEWLRRPEPETKALEVSPPQGEKRRPGESRSHDEVPPRSEIPLRRTSSLRRTIRLRRESRPFADSDRVAAEAPDSDRFASAAAPDPAAPPALDAAPLPVIPRRVWAEFEIDDGVVLRVRSDAEARRRKDIQQILRFAALILHKEDDTHE